MGELHTLEQLDIDLQRKSHSSATQGNPPSKTDKGIKSLAASITSKICDDGRVSTHFCIHFISNIYTFYNTDLFYKFQSKMIFPNGVKVMAKHLKHLDTISSSQVFDRSFINYSFMIFFSEKYILKQRKKGLARKEILNKFRESNRYDTMRNMYEYRILCDGHGDIKARFGIFKNTFRIKYNNWWNVHCLHPYK